MTQLQREAEVASIVDPVRDQLEEMSRFFAAELSGTSPRVKELTAHISRYRGKRLRSAQVLLSGLGFGNLTDEHVAVAAIVEMIHTATLVHDDILDEATIRRRLPSVNSGWGNDTAVLLGDYIYAKAFAISTGLQSQVCSKVLSSVTRTICQGEIEQIASRYDFGLTENRYLEVIGSKTASLYGAACQLGASYAGAPAQKQRWLHYYGWNLGMAFQIIDDCLDLHGTEEVVGKSLGTDVEEGKITLPVIHVLGKLNSRERNRLEEIYRDSKIQDRVACLRSEFDLAAGLDYSFERADRFIREALRGLDAMPANPARQSLETIAEYVLCRKW